MSNPLYLYDKNSRLIILAYNKMFICGGKGVLHDYFLYRK